MRQIANIPASIGSSQILLRIVVTLAICNLIGCAATNNKVAVQTDNEVSSPSTPLYSGRDEALIDASPTLVMANTEEAPGSEFRQQYREGLALILSGNTAAAGNRLEKILVFCLKEFQQGGRSFGSQAELDEFKRATNREDLHRVDMVCAYVFTLGGFTAAAAPNVDWPKALRSLTIASSIAPFFAGAWIERGYVYIQTDKDEDALAAYENAITLAESFDYQKSMVPIALRGKGAALIELGRWDEAELAYQKSLQYDPDNEVAVHQLKYIAGLQSKI